MRAWIVAMAAAVSVWTATAAIQQPQTSPYQQYAPIDLTGTSVSVVTEDWEYRMLAPAKGDFANLPLTQAARGGRESGGHVATGNDRPRLRRVRRASGDARAWTRAHRLAGRHDAPH
jgi:hypothetical protein